MQTLEKRAGQLRANAELQRIMGAWSGYLSGGQYDRLAALFSEDPDVWISVPWGTYRGTDGIRRLYHGLYRALYRKGDGGKPGVLTVSCVNTPVVDIFDTQASGSWISPGVFTLEDRNGANGLMSYWSWKSLRADFVKESSGWKILHLQIRPLMTTAFEKNWTQPQKMPWEDLPPEYAPDGPELPPLPELTCRSRALPDYGGTAWDRSDEARVLRLELIAEAQRLMGEYCTRMNAGRNRQVPELFALNTPTVRSETLQGVYDGPESIRRLYTGSPVPLPGGTCSQSARIQSLETPVIKTAGDCRTVRGVWVSPGLLLAENDAGEPAGFWSWRKYAADFVVEDGTLKIWHLHEYGLFETEHGSGRICASGTFSGQCSAAPDRGSTTPFRLSEDSVYPYAPAVPGGYHVYDPDFGY